MAKKIRERERDMLVEVREVEALSLECRRCACRFEFAVDGKLAIGARCPQCRTSLDDWRDAVETFRAFMRSTLGAQDVRLRVRLLKRLPL